MKLIEFPTFTLRDLARVARVVQPERSPGLHVTQITGEIMRRIDPKRYGQTFSKEDTENWQEAGFLWEDVLGQLLAARARETDDPPPWGDPRETRFRPGEIHYDGIIGSPDGIALCPDPSCLPIVEEYKFTWKSSSPFLKRETSDEQKIQAFLDTRFLPYLLQTKSYLKMVGGRCARMVIFFVNNDYKDFKPDARGFQLCFDQPELDEHWQSLVNTARAKGWL